MIGSLPNVYFAMGLHLHQPVGNFEAILERAYSNCYNPFLTILRNHRDIKCTFHFSGNLLDFFEEKHPDYLERVTELVNNGQVEIMGGGYYEPIFQAIPHRDRLGQIEMLSSYVEKKFGARPKGIWIPERVWTPQLIKDFVSCGIKYTILDDAHLMRAGIEKDNLAGYFVTGDKDNKLAIFPTTKILRYSIPFRLPRENIKYFKRASKKKKEVLFTYGDDAEKFGEWPWTHDWVYKKGWLNNFFNELRKNGKWLKTVTFSEYLDSCEPLGEVNIPEGTYEEMMGWAGGRWMNFLSRYPESDQMHKRMWYVSERVNNLVDIGQWTVDSGKLKRAQRELYKGQTNCPYWHGVFGGIYLYHLRDAIYEHLIKAENIVDEIEREGQTGWSETRLLDFYRSGGDAVIAESRDFFISIDPARGGIIRELDFKPENLNIINTLARRKEAYHRKIMERIGNRLTEPLAIQDAIKTIDKGIRRGIFYDRYLRACLIDHFIDKELKQGGFEDCNYMDLGGFAEAPYVVNIQGQKVILSREGMVDGRSVCVTKELKVDTDRSIGVDYTVKNNSSFELDNLFGIEFNVMMPFVDSDRYVYGVAGKSFNIMDTKGGLGIKFKFSEAPAKIWHFPVMAVSQSERSYDLNCQAYCIFPVWDINLAGGQNTRFAITWVLDLACPAHLLDS